LPGLVADATFYYTSFGQADYFIVPRIYRNQTIRNSALFSVLIDQQKLLFVLNVNYLICKQRQ